METFIHSVTDGLSLQSIAFCPNFDRKSDYIATASGRNLSFYRFISDNPELMYNYNLFDDVSLLIPYRDSISSLLIVIFSSMKFCILEFQTQNIECIQNGDLTSSIGVDIGTNFSYSIYQSLILIQFFQTNLQLYRIHNKKLIFIQNFAFFSSSISRFQLLSSNEFSVLLHKFEDNCEFQIYEFDLFTSHITEKVKLPVEINNFIKNSKGDFLMSSKIEFMNIGNSKIQSEIENIIHQDLLDMFEINENKILVLTLSGEIFIVKNLNTIKQIGSVIKPSRLIPIRENQVLIPSKYGDTYLLSIKSRDCILKPIFNFDGSIRKFLKSSNRIFYGLTKTPSICLIERTLGFNEMCMFQCPMQTKSWFVNPATFLFSSKEGTQLFQLNKSDKNALFQSNMKDNTEELQIPIQTYAETIAFKMLDGVNFIQILSDQIYHSGLSNTKIDYVFKNISLVAFSDDAFAICDNSNEVYIFDFSCNLIFHNQFEFQVNSLDLFSTQFFAISSWTSSSIYLFKNNEQTNQFELSHEFKGIKSISLLFIDNTQLMSLSTQSKVQFLSITDFTSHERKLKTNCQQLFKLNKDEIIISGKNAYLYKDSDITEIHNIKPFAFCDCFDDMVLLSHLDKSISLHSTKILYESTFTPLNCVIWDAIKYDSDQYALIFENKPNNLSLALTSDLENIEKYQIDQEVINQISKFKQLVLIEDQIFLQKFIVVALDHIIYSIVYNSSDERFFLKIYLEFVSNIIGLTPVEGRTFCVLLHDSGIVFSLDDGEFIKLSYFDTIGASRCFSFFNNKLLIGDLIESFLIYEFNGQAFTEKFRETHSIGASSCVFKNDDTLFVVDIGGFLYKLKTNKNESNYSSRRIAIEKTCSISSNAKSMIYDEYNDAILISTANGEIIEVKDIDMTHFDMRLYNQIENRAVSLGNLTIPKVRKIKCMGYYLGIPRIYDADILNLFLEMSGQQKESILHEIDPDLSIDIAQQMCHFILDQF